MVARDKLMMRYLSGMVCRRTVAKDLLVKISSSTVNNSTVTSLNLSQNKNKNKIISAVDHGELKEHAP